MEHRRLALTATLAALLLTGVAASAQVQIPLPPKKIPQFAQPLPQLGATGIPFTLGATVVDPANPSQQNVDITLCEFQTTILPAGTILAAGKAVTPPLTWVWGYQESAGVCNPLPGHSYLGPVVLAKRGTPTQMTFTNRLPDAAASMVQAYKQSTDQTVTWGDPLSLLSNAVALPITKLDGAAVWNPVIDPLGNYLSPLPETNECYLAARDFHLGIIAAMPLNCLDNYGFNPLAPAVPPRPAGTYIAPIPAAVHIHGGEVPAMLDGGPDSWWTPNGIYGHGFYSRGGVADAAAGKAVYVYPNGQEAAPIWFHDHILGATRLNVYAGIAGGYMVTDSSSADPLVPSQLVNDGKLAAGLLPLGLDRNANKTLDLAPGAEEVLIPLIIQDRMFDDAGQLYFPAVGINPEHPYWIPEFVGDTIAVNGAVWPVLTVQPQRYRFLVLNGSNARVYELGFANTTPRRKKPKKGDPPLPPLVTPGIYVIGNDQGYLDTPQFIPAGAAVANKLVIMPGERYEIIVDFAGAGGQTLELTNTAATPYPFGAPVNPVYDGKVMQIVVGPALAVADTSYDPAAGGFIRFKEVTPPTLPPTFVQDPIVRLANPATGMIAPGVTVSKVRRLTLNEVLTLAGPLEILVNNTLYDGTNTERLAAGFNDFTPVTSLWNTSQYSELPHEGETELWEIVNLTVDAHPMHPHLVGFQILNRQAFDAVAYQAAYDASFPLGVYQPGFGPPLDYNCGNGAPGPGVITNCVFGGNPDPMAVGVVGPIVPPSPQEIGWKDTFMVLPGMVNRALVRFGKTEAPVAAPVGYDFSPAEGHGYVWHCHIIDHEDNEMMRPYQVVADPAAPRNFVQGLNY